MGKGRRLRAQRQAAREWSVTGASRQGLKWRSRLAEQRRDKKHHHSREFEEHMERLRHATAIMHSHTTDESDTFEAAWLSFARPVLRLAFSSGLDVQGVRWHVPDPGTFDTEQILGVVVDTIETDRQLDLAALSGPLYVVSPDVHVVLAAAASTLSFRETGESFAYADLPAEAGLVILPDRAPWVTFPHVRAITWNRLPRVRWGERPEQAAPSMRMKAYAHASVFHHLRVSGGQMAVTTADTLFHTGKRDLEPCFGDLDPAHADELESFIQDAAEQRRANSAFIDQADDIAGQAGEPIGEARLDTDLGIPLTMSAYFAALVRALDQEILTAEPPESQSAAARPPQRRSARTEAAVQIVRLRRITGDSGKPARKPRWSHRWVVQMHKVRQWYPSENRHKVIWRGPYIKGPEGAPLKEPRERVHAFIR